MTPRENLIAASGVIEDALAVALAIPLLPPNARLVALLARAAVDALRTSVLRTDDVSDAQLLALMTRFDANEADDLAAQAEAARRELLLQKQAEGQ